MGVGSASFRCSVRRPRALPPRGTDTGTRDGSFILSQGGRTLVDPVPSRDDTFKGSGIPGLTSFCPSQQRPTLHRG